MRGAIDGRVRFGMLAVCACLVLMAAAVSACSGAGQGQAAGPTSTAPATSSTATTALPTTTTTAIASIPTASTESIETDNSSTTEYDAAAASSALDLLAKGLNMFQLGVSWSYEPRGDITGDTAAGELIYADVSKVSIDGSHVTFDAVQVYVGLPLAVDQAAKDGIALHDSVVYVRNAHIHTQTLPLADDASVILYAGAWGGSQDLEPRDLPVWGNGIGLFAPSHPQFGQLVQDNPDSVYGEYWIFIDRGKITGILQPYVE
jgi:hypothetical protein